MSAFKAKCRLFDTPLRGAKLPESPQRKPDVGSSVSVHHSKHGTCSRVSNQIDTRSIPVVVEVTSLSGVGCTIRVEQSDTLTTRMPDARIDNTFADSDVIARSVPI